jgi:hypothetical protein
MKNERSVEEPDRDDVVGLHFGTSQHSVEGKISSDGTSSHSVPRVDAAALPNLFETPLCAMITSAVRFSSSSDRQGSSTLSASVLEEVEEVRTVHRRVGNVVMSLHHRVHLWSLEIDFDFGKRRKKKSRERDGAFALSTL